MTSPFAQASPALVAHNLPVIPIMPGEKRPGTFDGSQWHGMTGWQRFNHTLPTPEEIGQWTTWPKANIGLLLGGNSKLVALDFDAGGPPALQAALQALVAAIPAPTKVGAKGFTSFYRAAEPFPEPSRKWTVNNESVLELLSTGRQTVLPPSLHPSGVNYRWEGRDLAQALSANDLPSLPPDFIAKVDAIVAQFTGRNILSHTTHHELGSHHHFWRRVNDAALANLEAWVPSLLPEARREKAGFRSKAVWRNGDGWNVSIHPNGIQDFARGEGLTPIDLVMKVCNIVPVEAGKWLATCLGIPDTRAEEDRKLQEIGERSVQAILAAAMEPPAVEEEPEPSEFCPPQCYDDILAGMGDGVLAHMVRHICTTAPTPRPWITLGGVLAALGTLCGQRYRSFTDIRTNIYTIAEAPSGAGKDHPRKCIKQGFMDAGIGRHIGGESIFSASGIFSALTREPRLLLQIDEFGIFIKGISDTFKSPRHLQEAKPMLLTAFSSANTTMMAAERADRAIERVNVVEPCLCIYGSTTPRELSDALCSTHVVNGFLNRFLLFRTPPAPDEPTPKLSQFAGPPTFPPYILERLRDVHLGHPSQGGSFGGNPNTPDEEGVMVAAITGARLNPYTVPMSNEAIDIFEDMTTRLGFHKRARKDTPAADLFGRVREQAIKIALIRAASDEPHDPFISPAIARWACAIVEVCLYDMVQLVERRVADNATEANLKNILRIISATGKNGVSKRDLTRKTQGLRTSERDDILKSLVEGERVTCEIVPKGQRPITIYRATVKSRSDG